MLGIEDKKLITVEINIMKNVQGKGNKQRKPALISKEHTHV